MCMPKPLCCLSYLMVKFVLVIIVLVFFPVKCLGRAEKKGPGAEKFS